MPSKILVIEDDPGALKLAADALQQEGYQVLTATNGVEGLKRAQEEEPDLLILDVLLPGMDGFELCHRLKNAPTTAKLPILILSAKSRESDRKMGLAVGADQYLAKPTGPAELVSNVGRLLKGKGADPVETGHAAEYLKFWSRGERQGEGR
jgi:DNA-binding response OmpR family regulator